MNRCVSVRGPPVLNSTPRRSYPTATSSRSSSGVIVSEQIRMRIGAYGHSRANGLKTGSVDATRYDERHTSVHETPYSLEIRVPGAGIEPTRRFRNPGF